MRTDSVRLPVLLLVLGCVPSLGLAQRQFAELGKQHLPIDHDNALSIALGDVNGDGRLDVVVGNGGSFGDDQNRLYLNDGNGIFTDVTATHLPPFADDTIAVALVDVDGDRDLDLVVANLAYGRGGQQDRLYLNDGNGLFTDGTASRLPTAFDLSQAVAFADLDRDGDQDLVVANSRQQNLLHLNDGTGRFTDATSGRMPSDRDGSEAIAVVDVDRDGDLDLFFANTTQSRLYLNDGKAVFTDETGNRVPVYARWIAAVAAADVDLDGDPDLLLGVASGPNLLYLNDGKGFFIDASANLPANGDRTRAVALVDVDLDGDPDALIGSLDRNQLWRNDGRGVFTASAALPMNAEETAAVASGDLDGDGCPEIVFGNNNRRNGAGAQERLYSNLLRRVDAPFLARIGREFRLDFHARPGLTPCFNLALPAIATGEQRLPLPPYGTFGLDPTQMVLLETIYIPPPGGMQSLSLPVPNAAVLVGHRVFTQALMLDPLLDPHFTNVTGDRIH